MKKELLKTIRDNPYLYSLLREESYHYTYLLQDDNYLKKLEERAKIKYKQTAKDKLEYLEENLEMINTFFNIIE